MSNLNLKRPSVSAEGYVCGVCHRVLNAPQQTSCCGSHFCHDCLKCAEMPSVCPKCQAEDISYFHDISFERQIKASLTSCTQDGCIWTGEYGDLEAHLNECGFVKTNCEFNDVGCMVVVPKGEMHTHLQDSCSRHLQLTFTFMMKKMESLQTYMEQNKADKDTKLDDVTAEIQSQGDMLETVQQKIKELDVRVNSLDKRMMFHALLPYKIVIPSVDQYIHGTPGVEWKSPEFYTGSFDNKGYKVQLRVVPNSLSYTRNREKALSARLFIVKGESCAPWPFHAKFTLEIIDPSGSEQPFEVTGRHTWKSPNDESSMRFQACIAHKDLIKYTEHDGCLHIIII